DVLRRKSPEELDRYVRAISEEALAAARELAEAAVRESGFGVVEDKILKNSFAARDVAESVLKQCTAGVLARDPERGIVEYAVPMGVVAAIIPCTNPTSTAVFKALISVKAGCAVVMSPHPRTVACTRRAAEICQGAVEKAGGPAGAVSCLSGGLLAATRELMGHELTDVILATGGMGLVRAAYSSGKPAFGVGPGNVPVYVDRSADVENAVKQAFRGTTFDNGVVCSCEQSIIADTPVAERVREECAKNGGYFLGPEETTRVSAFLFPTGEFEGAAVGQSARWIAEKSGVFVPETTTVLLAELPGVGPVHPLSAEKLCPVLAFYTADGWRAGCERCIELINFGGLGHTISLHARNAEVVEAFAREKPVCRVLVNTCAALGAVGLTTNLEPSLTLGPGAWGGSATGDNVTARHLVNVKRLAYDREGLPARAKREPTDEEIALVVRRVLDELGL
ncbi:MAG TPA: aldehyde dehydrogenase family protein, partial [Candidatus Coatesbacteria bacterium]|nr:aldehyde dehydrogenase family protein [Candidatus Coatesbacteria bacterium]